MSKMNNANRMPRAKGMDMAAFYTPKECRRKAQHMVSLLKMNALLKNLLPFWE